MSLQVWLPLTKDLRNQGLANVIVTNYGATLDNNGKLGKCYYFDGTDDRITVNGLSLPNVWSYSCWIYSATSSRSWEAIIMLNSTGGDSDLQLGFYTYPGGNRIQNTANGQYNSGIAWTYGMWHHFCGTFDGSNLRTYIDGILIDTKAITASLLSRTNLTIGARSTNTANTTANTFFQGKLNDVRIYDHCLSPMEVKELAKGLVLHYPLNRQGWGQENLVINSINLNNFINESATYVSLVRTPSDLTAKIITTPPSGSRYGFYQDIDCTVSTQYTVSFEVVSMSGDFACAIGSRTGNSIGWSNLSGYTTCTIGKNIKTFTTINDCTKLRIYLGALSNNSIIVIKNVKLEKGSVATPWCPNSSDALATTMGLNGTTEYDCSGFCNNGTKTGTFNWTSDTPKYGVSTYFGGNNYILTDSGSFSWFSFDKCTIALWMKPNSTPSDWAGSVGISHNNSSGNKTLAISNYGGLFTVQSANGSWANFQSSALAIGTWYHLVCTLDGNTLKMYLNGELVKTDTLNWNSVTVASDTRVQVGIDLPGSDEISIAWYSDVRIYATALSADDVKSLYQNEAYIDSSNNIHGKIR